MNSPGQIFYLAIIVAYVSPVFALAAEEIFSIRTASLKGDNPRTIYTDNYRQATHIRVSPDGQWIMFTRYNDKDPKDGLAKENWGGRNHYENTELLIMRTDGSELKTLVASKEGIMAVNSNWTDDGRGFVFVSTDNKKQTPEIRRAFLSSSMEIIRFETITLPKHLIPVDPHLLKGKLVFPAVDLRNMVRGLWIVNEDGSGLRRLTTPINPDSGEVVNHPTSGDNDPRFSPSGSKVAFMRLVKGHSLWQIYVVDVATGKEVNLSGQYLSKNQIDAVPEWSGDGDRLVFWTVDFKKVVFTITSMRPDGTRRATVPGDSDVFYQSPAFFPGTGSGPDSIIVFSTWTVPKWKLKVMRFFSKFK